MHSNLIITNERGIICAQNLLLPVQMCIEIILPLSIDFADSYSYYLHFVFDIFTSCDLIKILAFFVGFFKDTILYL